MEGKGGGENGKKKQLREIISRSQLTAQCNKERMVVPTKYHG